MAITYNDVTDTIIVTGIGNDFADIKTANDTGGWNKVDVQGNQYLIKANLDVGDDETETDLKDTLKHIQIGLAADGKRFRVRTNATFQLGTLETGRYTGDYGGRGNSLSLFWSTEAGYWVSLGTLKLYGVTLYINYQIYFRLDGAIDFRNCIIMGTGSGNIFFGNLQPSIMKRITFFGIESSYGAMIYSSQIDMNDIIVENRNYGFVCGWQKAVVIKNAILNDNLIHQFRGHPGVSTQSFSIYDTTWNENKLSTLENATAWLKDYKSFNLKVLDKDNNPINSAAVKIEDSQGNITNLTTGEDGTITEQNLLIAYYVNNGVGGGIGPDYYDKTNYNPFILTIVKGGYDNYECEFTLDKEKDWTVAMIIASPNIGESFTTVIAADDLNCMISSTDLTATIIDDDLTCEVDSTALTAIISEDALEGTIS